MTPWATGSKNGCITWTALAAVVRQRATHYVRDAQGNPFGGVRAAGRRHGRAQRIQPLRQQPPGMLTTADTLVCKLHTAVVHRFI